MKSFREFALLLMLAIAAGGGINASLCNRDLYRPVCEPDHGYLLELHASHPVRWP